MRATRAAFALSVMVGVVLIAVTSAAPLPAGNSGIAARYPFDAGIASDPAVIFADDFESYGSAANLTTRWSQAYHAANLRIATEPGNVFGGAKSVELTVPRTSAEVSNTLLKSLGQERDTLFLRYEMMVKANTPGQRDGRVAFWLDGELIADFTNLRLRDTPVLKIDRFTIDLHVYGNTLALARKWYDNVVAATSYIGPMASRTPPRSPTGFRIVR